MALSGTLNTTDYQGRYIQFKWEATQSSSTNKSTVTWTLKGAGDASSSWYWAAPFYLSIGGKEISISSTRIKLEKGTLVKEGTTTITHNDEGKGSFAVVVKAAIYSNAYNCSGSKTFTLDTIPRRATITESPSTLTDESTPTIKYKNPVGNNVTSLKVAMYKGGNTALADYRAISSPGTTGSYKFTFTSGEKEKIQKACTTANSMTVRFYIRTEIGDFVDTHYTTATLSIKDGAVTISPVVADTNQKTVNLTGDLSKFVKYYSTATYNFNETYPKQATNKSRKLTNGTKTATASTGSIANVESGSFKFEVTDSRNNPVSKTLTKTLVNYVKLTCSMEATAKLADDNTATITLSIKGNYFNGSFGAVNNSLSLWYRMRKKGADWKSDNSDWVSLTATKSGNTYSCSKEIPGKNYKDEFEIEAIAQDKLWEQYGNYKKSAVITISAKPVFDWSKEDFNFNVPVTFSGDEWHNLTWADNFKCYNDNSLYQAKYKVCGNVVTVKGVATPKADFTSTADSVTFASGIPAKYRPDFAQHAVCQGSGMNRWLLSVGSGGGLTIARYGISESSKTCSAGSWLPFTLTYMI